MSMLNAVGGAPDVSINANHWTVRWSGVPSKMGLKPQSVGAVSFEKARWKLFLGGRMSCRVGDLMGYKAVISGKG
jgi:hypothetical protein